MRRPIRPAAGRGGFTLVELLVAAALALVVMTILAFAFQTGLGTLSQLKSVVGLADQLRAAEEIMKRDLGDPVLAPDVRHLEDGNGDRLRLSGLAFDQLPARGYFRVAQYTRPFQGDPNATSPWGLAQTNPLYGIEYDPNPRFDPAVPPPPVPPATGPAPPYFRGYWYEGNDDNLTALSSFRVTDHVLQFTVKLPGRNANEVFLAPLPDRLTQKNWPANGNPPNPVLQASLPGYDPTGTKFASQWAEVSYSLEPNGTLTVDASDPNAPSAAPAPQLPVYALIRRQRVLAPPGAANFSGELRISDTSQPQTVPPTGPLTVADLAQSPDLAMSYVSTASPPYFRLCTPSTLGGPKFNPFATDPANKARRASDRIGGIYDPFGSWQNEPNPAKRLLLLDRPYRIPAASPEYGSDVLLNNVLSMQVRVITDLAPAQYADPPANAQPANQFNPPPPPTTPLLVNSVPAGTKVDEKAGMLPPRQIVGTQEMPVIRGGGFDTAINRDVDVIQNGSSVGAFSYRIKAIQIKLRVYDAKNKITRQMTIVQDL